MKRTNDFNARICEILDGIGVKYTVSDRNDCIMVDRTSMVQVMATHGEHGEDSAYSAVLDKIRTSIDYPLYITWSGRTDEWLSIEVLERPLTLK